MHDLITKASPANFSPLFIMAFTVLPWLDMVCFGLPVLGFPVLCTGVAYDELRIHTSSIEDPLSARDVIYDTQSLG
jgi:hypothetical protein